MSRLHTPLLHTIQRVLEEDPRVIAAWLEGSLARSESDDYSDIDLWVTVKDADFEGFIDQRDQFAAQLGSVTSIVYPKTIMENDEIDSFSIIFEEYSITTSLDVTVQKESRKSYFTKDSDAEECVVLFDKKNILKWKPFDAQKVEKQVEELFDDIVVRFWHTVPRVYTYVRREDVLEAMNAYMECVEYFIMMHRILYTPEKVEWGFKDIEYDLPEEVIKQVYDVMPYPNAKTIQKLLHKLAKLYLKQSKIVSKRLKKELPVTLIKQVLAEL